MTDPEGRTSAFRRGDAVAARVIAVVLIVLGSLPLANWIPAGLSDVGYSRRWTDWLLGTAICVGAGVVVGILGPRLFPAVVAATRALATGCGAWIARRTIVADAILAAVAIVAYGWIARVVFDGRPLLIDEIVQVLQARMYAACLHFAHSPQ